MGNVILIDEKKTNQNRHCLIKKAKYTNLIPYVCHWCSFRLQL